jgi:hypothetical protein
VLKLDRGFADELPYPDGSFDRVLSSLMFHHLEADSAARLCARSCASCAPAARCTSRNTSAASRTTGGPAHSEPDRETLRNRQGVPDAMRVVRTRGVDLVWRERPRSEILETAICSVIALAPTGDNHNRGGHSCLRSLRRQRRTFRSSVL